VGTQDSGTSWFGRATKTIEGHCDVLPMDRHHPTKECQAEQASRLDGPGAAFEKAPLYRGRIVVAIDATTSRLWYWQTARRLQDYLLDRLPPDAPVALAVYAFGLDSFTPFTTDRTWLRARAAAIQCNGLRECLPAVLRHTLKLGSVDAVINISDLTALCDQTAYQYARQLRGRGTRVFILADPVQKSTSYTYSAQQTYSRIAAHTGGSLLPFAERTLPVLLDQFNHGIPDR
jgi:hypothetical protein